MKGKHLWLQKGLSVFLSAAMMLTSIPASAATVPAEGISLEESVLADYDFAKFTTVSENNTLVNGDTVIQLEKVGEGVMPSIVEDARRGKVLSCATNDYANRAYALLPSNPFAADDLEDGLTLNFWTKTNSADKYKALIDFEIAPAADANATADPDRAGTMAVNQGMIFYNVTSQNEGFADINIGNVGFNDAGWIMVTIAMTKEGFSVYRNGELVEYTVDAGTADYEKILTNLAGEGELVSIPRQTNVRLGASLATYWSSAEALLDDITFYGKALSQEEITSVYNATAVAVPVESVTINGAKSVQVGDTIKLKAGILPEDTTDDKTVTWKSNDESILTVSKDGEVTGVKVGKTTVTATVSGKTSEAFEISVVAAEAGETGDCIASYDFADYELDGDTLTDGKSTILLESVGSGVKPALVEDEKRGQVLQLTEQTYANRAYALLPKNPFAGKDYTNGFTVNFWTKTTGTVGGGRCLLDFEVAPQTTGRAGTLAMNQSMVYWNTTDQDGSFTDFKISNMKLDKEYGWKMYTMAVTTQGITFYRDGEKISHSISSGVEDYESMIKEMAGAMGESFAKPGDTNVRLGASLATYWSCAGAYMDELSFWGKALSDEEVAQLYQDTLIQVPLESVTVEGVTSLDQEKTATYTVALTPADTTVSKAVTWKSSDENVLKIDKNGLATAVNAGTANITATVAGMESAPFEVTVNAVDFQDDLSEGKYLAVYTTSKNFYASAANVAQETRSVYFAVSEDGKTFRVLNNGGGVIFSKNTSGTLQISDPRIFKDEEGNFTVVAIDATESKGYHVFTSTDGVNYYDDTIVAADKLSEDLKTAPMKKSTAVLTLDGANIIEEDATIELGNAVALTDEEYTYIVNKLDTIVNTGLEKMADLTVENEAAARAALAGKYSSVNATYSDGSVQKFNVDWSAALKNVDLSKAGTYTLTGTVNQTKYLNNLKAINGSNLYEDDPANVSATEADNYDEETGTVYYDATKFVEGMADPCIFWDEQTGYYYMTGSYFPQDGDEIDAADDNQPYDRVVLRKAKTLEGLQDRSNQVTIWKVGNQGYTSRTGTTVRKGYRYIWAPEIHRVGDKWVIYFTESEDASNAYGIYSHVLVLDGNLDPYATALKESDEESQWADYAMTADESVEANTAEGIAANPFNTAFCLDMTYFKDAVNGESYVIWAGKPTKAYQGGNTDLFIAKVDVDRPWVITSSAHRLTYSDYGWERIRYCVNEGATVLQKDGNIFMCYSASGTGSEYAIGMLSAKAGEDLLDISNWTKSPYPVLTSRDVDGEEGPGHNSFTVDKDGNAIFVYHARPTSHNYKMCGWDGTSSCYNGEPLLDPCRHARLKRVHWAADGTPVLKMTYDEELLNEYKTVSVKITVKNSAVTPVKVGVGQTQTDATGTYVVTNAATGAAEVTFKAAANKTVKSVKIPATVTIGNTVCKVTKIEDNAFKGCKKLTKVTIPTSVETIGKSAFSGCTALKSITIPANVKTIDSKAFEKCKNLKTITIKSTKLKKVGKSAFKGINKKAKIKVPKKQKKAYQKLLKKKGQASTVTIK